MLNLDQIISEINKYSSKVCTTYPGISNDIIDELENKLGFVLPRNFRLFLNKCNGLEISSETVYGIHAERHLDLYDNYICEKDEVGNPIWDYLLPISPNGRGDHYCLDLSTLTKDKSECKVIFWQHDREFSEDDPPIIDAETVLAFLWQLLEDVKETTNYDGTDK
jgi:cell wall assembly regulator SMI1